MPERDAPERDAPAVSDRRRWIALSVVCLAVLMNTLDTSIVNVALPSIQHDLHFSPANLAWVVDAYLITFGSFLLMAGRLGDIVGRKPVFLTGVVIFTAASGVCAAAPDQATLIVARFVQGLGGALSSSVIVAVIVAEFPGRVERAKAMSAYILVAVGGGSLGLLAGGILTEFAGWRWVFIVNLPIGILTYALGRPLLSHTPRPAGDRNVDVVGSILVTVALMLGIYAITETTDYGWISPRTIGVGVGALVLLGGFVLLEARLANPIMPLRILRLRTLSGSSVVRGFLASGMFSIFFFGALYLEHIRGYTPLRTGLAFLPMTLTTAVMSCGITARLVLRFGPMRVLIPGMLAGVAGLIMMAEAGANAPFWVYLCPAFALLGLGGGTAMMPLLAIGMSDVPPEDAGLASGIVSVSLQLSSAVGIAVLGTIAADHTKSLTGLATPAASALLAGYHLAFFVAALVLAAGIALALILLTGPVRRAAAAESGRRVVSSSADPMQVPADA